MPRYSVSQCRRHTLQYHALMSYSTESSGSGPYQGKCMFSGFNDRRQGRPQVGQVQNWESGIRTSFEAVIPAFKQPGGSVRIR